MPPPRDHRVRPDERASVQTTIAEGIETHEQLRELTTLDCDLAQGYLWSRPVEAEEVAEVMEDVGKITDDRLVLV